MNPNSLTRRKLLVGCSSAIAALAGSRLTNLALARSDQGEVLVVVFLRGGMDGLSLVAPYADPYYNDMRPTLRLPQPGTGPNAALDLDGQFGLNAAAAPLRDLFQQKHLAIVHAAGLTSDTRSHFDAMEFIERGTPGSRTTASGWITRHLTSAQIGGQLPAVAVASLMPTSLLGSSSAVAMPEPTRFGLDGYWAYVDQQRHALRHAYNGDTWLHTAGMATLDTVDIIDLANPQDYVPEFGAVYPQDSFGETLKTIAQLIKLDIGLHVATADAGGWDTHEQQGEGGGGYFGYQIDIIARGLMAFYTDLTQHAQRLTVVVLSEFGRRVRENGDYGTDHGHGNVMLVLGGQVNGGRVFASPWPGLAPAALDQSTDLAITTDYRRVLSEILVRRLGNPNLGQIFPRYTGYAPLGIVQGTDLPIKYGNDQRTYLPTLLR